MDKIYIYKDSQSEWRWNRKSENGRIVSTGAEGYHNKDDAITSAKNVNSAARVYVNDEYLTDWE
jgi:uncharacterized protein YegP (UPF0339 family)